MEGWVSGRERPGEQSSTWGQKHGSLSWTHSFGPMQPSRRSQIPMPIAAADRSPAESATTRCSGSCAGKGGWAPRLQGGRDTGGARFKLLCGRLATPRQQLRQVVAQALQRQALHHSPLPQLRLELLSKAQRRALRHVAGDEHFRLAAAVEAGVEGLQVGGGEGALGDRVC